MKILFKIISAFLYFHFVSPVQMYYIYDDNPNIGFMTVDNAIGSYMRNGFSAGKAGKKQFTGAYSNLKYQKVNSEHVVDSHFRVRKTQPKNAVPFAPSSGNNRPHETGKNKAQRIVEEYRKTEQPKPRQEKPQLPQMVTNSEQRDKQITQISNKTPVRGDYGAKPKESAAQAQPSIKQQNPPIRPKAVNADYSNSMMQRNKDAASSQINQDTGRGQRIQDVDRIKMYKDEGRSQTNQDSAYDSKPTYAQMNARKAQMPAGTQKTILNNNRQLTSLPVLTAPDKRQRIPASMIMDKTLHKTHGIAHDHNMQIMSRVLDDMTQKIADRRLKKGEYTTRDAGQHMDVYEKTKRSVVVDNMRKYIGKDKIGKDIRNQHKLNTALARIGSHEESLELDDTPYAVFYRMNPETLDQHDGFMIMRSMNDNGNSDFTNKEKSLHAAFEGDTENMANKHRSIKSAGGTLHRKKLKKFSNFRSH